VDIRVKKLAGVDPRAAPLPHGTEVVTRVERVLADERRVPQGAVGRVVGVNGEQIDVAVVGVGVVRYARDEVLPRKLGQVRYAERRDAAWSALRSCVVLEAVVGSRAWGLDDETSDTDRRGLFVLPLPWSIGLGEPPRDLVSEDGSETFWEVKKGVEQALRADPNTLEMLFVDDVRAVDEMGQWILDARESFVSSEIHGTFARYALSQLARLRQVAELAEHRHEVLAWLREEPTPSLDIVAARLADRSPRTYPTRADAELSAKQWIKQLYRSLYDQGLIPARDLDALVKFAREQAPELELPREVRPKNAYNLVRLIATANEWLRTGTASLRVSGPMRARLLAIKRGEVPLEQVLAQAEALAEELEEARRITKLPKRGDVVRADAVLRRIGEEVARRWIARADGPFGKDATQPPAIAWEDP
jgi:hypothetical protein